MGRSSYALEGIGDIEQIVRRNGAFEPGRQSAFLPEYYVLWNRIGEATTVEDLLMCGEVTPSHAVVILRELINLGAITLKRPPTEPPVLVEDTEELGVLSQEEARYLAEDVELQPWEKRRILSAIRTLRSGDYHQLLGVRQGADKRELKRAYYQISKEFHPDRYYGRNLGSFGRLLERVFETATQAVRTLSDARTVVPAQGGPTGPRRRTSPRFAYTTRVRLSCGSWGQVQELFTGDVSEGGLFVPTTTPASVGDSVAMELAVPEGSPLILHGIVVSARQGASPGLGIKLDPMPAPQMARFYDVLNQARQGTPAPALTDEPVRPRRFPRGTGPQKTQTPIVGIDLGTSYTCVSAAVGDRVTVLKFADGLNAIPSVVGFPMRGKVVVGQEAKHRLLTDPRHTVASAKRLLGRKADERDVEAHLAQASYETSVGPDGSVLVDMWGEPYAIPQICSYLLAAAREAAAKALEGPVERAVLTVPVSFGKEAIEMVKRAGKLAHLDVIDVLDEPSAAAVANRYRPNFGGLIGIYDFGGGTFDFSVVDASGGDFRVLATAGDSWLGGDDFDLAMAEAVANRFWQAYGVDLRNRAVEWQHLIFQCEKAKRQLSGSDETKIEVPEVLRTVKGTFDLRLRLTRAQVERLWAEPIRRSLAVCGQALTLAGLRPSDLSAIYLSGGTSYIPVVRRSVQRQLQRPVYSGVPPEFAACLGAGIHAAQIERRVATTLRAVTSG